MGTTLSTRVGAIDVTIQDGRTAYIRVATGDNGTSSHPGDTTTEPLQLPRGVRVSGRGHFTLAADGWRPSYTDGFHRDGRGMLTPRMREQLHGAIVAALAEQVDADELAESQKARNAQTVAELHAQMDGLERMRDQLRAQATALELDPGARMVYVEQRLRSGTSQSARAVRTSDGELRFVDEPRAAVSESYLRRYLGEPANWTEKR